GLSQADVVIEEKVEDGVTRFFSIFQSHDSDPVGPVRSARSTDIALVTPLDHPLFAYSGTNATFQKLVNAAPLVDVGVSADPGAYGRRGDRPAPYNLFTSTSALYRRAPAGGKPPPPMFPYRSAGQALTGGAGAGSAATVTSYTDSQGAAVPLTPGQTWVELPPPGSARAS